MNPPQGGEPPTAAGRVSRVVRVALTQTKNVYPDMPATVADLGRLAPRLESVRRANVEHHLGLMEDARERQAQIICFGELFTSPFFALRRDPMWRAMAEDALTGPTVTELRGAARELSLIVVAPIYELDARTGKRFDTAVVIDERGDILGTYRKTHLPGGPDELGDRVEGSHYERSDGKNHTTVANVSKNPFFPVFQTSLCRVGVALSHDRHVEGVVSSLAREGAELVFSPAITYGSKARRLWHLEFSVEAARHNLFIAGSNRRGAEPPWNQPFFGESYIVGPNGLLEDQSARADLVIADVDLAALRREESTAGWKLPRDGRQDIFTRGS
jgi:beta-ureidopropionase